MYSNSDSLKTFEFIQKKRIGILSKIIYSLHRIPSSFILNLIKNGHLYCVCLLINCNSCFAVPLTGLKKVDHQLNYPSAKLKSVKKHKNLN